MGIKTGSPSPIDRRREPLKNLPTTWGLRLECHDESSVGYNSEKPPHHMGIKT